MRHSIVNKQKINTWAKTCESDMVSLYSLDLTENILIFYIRILHCFDIKARLVRKSDLRAHHSRTLQLHSSSDSTIIKQLLAPGLPSIPCVLPVS